jgi:hypothetical protein
MAALVEGLAGVKDNGIAFSKVALSPRWPSAGIDSVNVTIQYPSSSNYISYQYKNDKKNNFISILITGSGNSLNAHVLLPENVKNIRSVSANNQPVKYNISVIEGSRYADLLLPLNVLQALKIKYE